MTTLTIPRELLPGDGRFGCGPAKVRPEAVSALAATGTTLLGTSHRQAPVKNLVGAVREGLAELFRLPDGYEVVLGNGGSTLFWDLAASAWSSGAAPTRPSGSSRPSSPRSTTAAPHLEAPSVVKRRARVGRPARGDAGRRRVRLGPQRDLDRRTGPGAADRRAPTTAPWCWSTAPRPPAARRVDVAATDAYYFAPQKSLGSDGGLWLALLSPAAIERAERIAATDRWIPESLSLTTAITNSRQNQTLNTPAHRHALPAARPADAGSTSRAA